MIVIGIDIGIKGAIAVFDDGGCRTVIDMPVKQKASGKGNQVDPAGLHAVLSNLGTIRACFIELVGASPQMGVTGAFSFGKSAGIVEGIVGSLGIPTKMVAPQTWKARAGLIGKKKDEARLLAIDLCPEVEHLLTLKKHVDRADAILICMYGES